MFRKTGVAFAIIALILFSCSGDKVEDKKQLNNQTSQEEVVKEYYADKEADFTIEGMSCMINCVTSVKNALKKMDGVTSVEVDFDEERTEDLCKVRFDGSVLSIESIKAVIESVNEGSYKVLNMVVRDIQKENEVVYQSSGKSGKKDSFSASNNSFSLPSIFDFVSALF